MDLFGGMLRCWKNAEDGTYHALCTHSTPHPILTREEAELIPKFTHIPPKVVVPVLYKKMLESVHSYGSCDCRSDCTEYFDKQIEKLSSETGVFKILFGSIKPFVDVHMRVSLDESEEHCQLFVRAAAAAMLDPGMDRKPLFTFVQQSKVSIVLEQDGKSVLRIGCSYVEFDIKCDMVVRRGSGPDSVFKFVSGEWRPCHETSQASKEEAISAFKSALDKKQS
jgi:hypothetical protein